MGRPYHGDLYDINQSKCPTVDWLFNGDFTIKIWNLIRKIHGDYIDQ